MVKVTRGLEVARHSTVRICDRAGKHQGQGLILDLDAEGTVVLTCHHVIAPLSQEDLCIAMWADGQLGQPLPVQYDERHSHPEMDAVVLRVDGVRLAERPLLHTLNPKTYMGSLPERAIGLTYWKTDTFDARVGTSTRLDIPVDTPGQWPNPPTRYVLPSVYRLADPSDARQGISGSVVIYEGGVLGLAHFSRPAGPDQEREVYLVPLTVWAEEWPTLSELIEPLIDAQIKGAATIKRARMLKVGEEAGSDIVIAGYRSDVYIERTVESLATTALEQRDGVVIIGKPKSGKTRLAWKMMQERPEMLVVIPHADPPNTFVPTGLVGKGLVLFFDDLHQTNLNSNPLEWKRRLEDATGQRCLLICTSRDGKDWKLVQNQPRLAGLRDRLGRDACIYTSRVGGKGEDLSQAQGEELAKALGLSYVQFTQHFDGTLGSLTLNLEDMRERYERLCEEPGVISMSRLLDSAKLIYKAKQPHLHSSLIRQVAEQIRGEGGMSREMWDRLKQRTQEEGFGYFNPDSDEFQTYGPYLEECVTYSPSTEEVEALLPILIGTKDYEGLTHLGQALLVEYHSLQAAERASRAAIEGGNTTAYDLLALTILDQPGRESEVEQICLSRIEVGETRFYQMLGNCFVNQRRYAEAEQAYRDAIKTGVGMIAYYGLGEALYMQPGREQEAEQAYRVAIDLDNELEWAGNTYRSLGRLLTQQPGREAEAEQAYRSAIKLGIWEELPDVFFAKAYSELARLLTKQPGREAEAEQACRAAIQAGNIEAYMNLGIILARQPGREAEAEQTYRAAIQAGNIEAYFYLGLLLAGQPGREAEAEQTYRAAIDAGDTKAYSYLGDLLAGLSGREAEAEQACRDAIQAGIKVELPKELFERAYSNLAFLLTQQPGREAEAEQACRAAIQAGDIEAYSYLGVILTRQPGRETEAEQAFRDAIQGSDINANLNLGIILANQPGREAEAEEAFQAAIQAGSGVKTYYCLGNLLSRQAGREQDAERAYRVAVDMDRKSEWASLAQQSLGQLLTRQPGREAEAEKALQAAIKSGKIEAYTYLGEVLTRQPGREAEAEQALQAAIKSGDTRAYSYLGRLFIGQPGREAEAEQACRAAIQERDIEAYYMLGLILAKQPGREAEAEQACRDAIEVGDTKAAYMYLGIILNQQPGREIEAEQAYRAAIEAGNLQAYYPLGVLLSEKPGREIEAEQTYRAAIEAGEIVADLDLGLLLVQQPMRKLEGCEALRKAEASGIEGAAEALREFCT